MVLVPSTTFQTCLMFEGKASSLPYSGSPVMCLTRVGSSLNRKYKTRFQRRAKDKHFSLLQTFVNYDRKKFNIWPWSKTV
jgi:hypothetical protein